MNAYFTKKEDDVLMKFVDVDNISDWSVIAGQMPNRTENQISKRYKQLVEFVYMKT